MNRDRIGKYQILGELGRGTMGEVYRARDPILHREVALKTLSVRVGPDEDALERFQREARAAAGLNHPNIVTIHDFGQDGGILYIAMELLEGTDLRDAIDIDSLRDLDEKLAVMDAVLSGLDYAHARGVIHRDIKPANIHLGPGGQVKIMDFGLARDKYSDMTQDGIVVGTPNYMSPEQALGERVDARSDVFSTGAVLYELLTGHKPFEADSTPSVLFQVVHREAPPVRRWAPGVPDPIVAVVERALVKDRARRFEGAAEMRQALLDAGRAAQGGHPVAPPLPANSAVRSASSSGSLAATGSRRSGSSPAIGARRRRSSFLPAALWTGLVVALVAAGATLWLTLRERRPPEVSPGRSDQQVGELTKALVATQIQLAQRELQDKNWAAAVAQAESALHLSPGHPEAMRSLTEARERIAELDQAIAAARERLAAGDTEGASLQLSHLLELDPRHPAAAELSARLNDVFRSQAEAADASMRTARDEARAAGATDSREFRAADAAAREATGQAEREEFADATRNFLEARDAFDRARRAARAPASSAGPSTSGPAASARPAPPSLTRNQPEESANGPGAPALPGRTTPAPPASTPLPPPRVFAADKTTVTTPSAGALAGFETEDVRTRRQPRFVGHMVFEVLPPEVRPGEPFVVRVHLVNEGKKTVRVRGIELSTLVNGERTTTPAPPLSKEVAARSRALVAEFSSTWTATGSWALEAVVLADDDEQVRSRLTAD